MAHGAAEERGGAGELSELPAMPREMCYRCFRPKAACLCADIVPMPTRTRFVLLMSPKEFKEEKAATGRRGAVKVNAVPNRSGTSSIA